MKRILFFSILVLLITSCAKDEVLQNDRYFDEPELELRGVKIDVCHKGKIINISINAVAAHQAHGDAVDMDGDGYFNIENDCGMPVDCDDTDYTLTDDCCPEFTTVTMDYEMYFDLETGTECEDFWYCGPEYDLRWPYNADTEIHGRMWWHEQYTDMALVYDKTFCELLCSHVDDYYFCEHINDPNLACANTDTPPVDFVGIYFTYEGNYWVVEWLSQDEENYTVTFRYRQLLDCP